MGTLMVVTPHADFPMAIFVESAAPQNATRRHFVSKTMPKSIIQRILVSCPLAFIRTKSLPATWQCLVLAIFTKSDRLHSRHDILHERVLGLEPEFNASTLVRFVYFTDNAVAIKARLQNLYGKQDKQGGETVK
jgi:hypothetical protein